MDLPHGLAHGGKVAQLLADLQERLGPSGRIQHVLDLLRRDADRLLAIHVLAGLKAAAAISACKIAWGSDDDRIDIR